MTITELFIKTVYPDMTELAMAANTEESCLRDATKLINDLRAELERITNLYNKSRDETSRELRYRGLAEADLSACKEWVGELEEAVWAAIKHIDEDDIVKADACLWATRKGMEAHDQTKEG